MAALDFLHPRLPLSLRSLAHLTFSFLVFSLACFGPPPSASDNVHVSSALLFKSFTSPKLLLIIPDLLHLSPLSPPRSFTYSGSAFSVHGVAWSEPCLSPLDLAHAKTLLLFRSFARTGSLTSALGLGRFGPVFSPSALDSVHLDSSPPLKFLPRLASLMALLDSAHVRPSSVIRRPVHPGPSALTSRCARSRPVSSPPVPENVHLESSSLLRILSRSRSATTAPNSTTLDLPLSMRSATCLGSALPMLDLAFIGSTFLSRSFA